MTNDKTNVDKQTDNRKDFSGINENYSRGEHPKSQANLKPFMENYHKYISDGGKAKLLKFFFQEDFRQFEIPHETVFERAERKFIEKRRK